MVIPANVGIPAEIRGKPGMADAAASNQGLDELDRWLLSSSNSNASNQQRSQWANCCCTSPAASSQISGFAAASR